MKIGIGLYAGSLAVVGDGIDSSTDVVISIITLITARILSRPPDKKYPYGYGKADTIATKALSFVIFFAGLQLMITTITKLVTGEVAVMPDKLAIYVTVFSILGKFFLSVLSVQDRQKNRQRHADRQREKHAERCADILVGAAGFDLHLCL